MTTSHRNCSKKQGGAPLCDALARMLIKTHACRTSNEMSMASLTLEMVEKGKQQTSGN